MDQTTIGLIVLGVVIFWVWVPTRTEIREAMERKERAKEMAEKRK